MSVINKLVLKNVNKHKNTLSLAKNTELMMADLVSKTLSDGYINAMEFTHILNMIKVYDTEKKNLRKGKTENVKEEMEDAFLRAKKEIIRKLEN